MDMKCPQCGGTLKYKIRFSKDKRYKPPPRIIHSLECARCEYVKPKAFL